MTKIVEDEVRQTLLDYFEGWFDADGERMDRALHPELVKRSWGTNGDASLGASTSKERMLELTAAGAGRVDGVDRTLEIVVEDLFGDVATATVRSAVYYEYVQLVRTPDGWRIVNALWRLR